MGVKVKRFGGRWMVALLSVGSLMAQVSDLRLADAVREGDRETIRVLLDESVDVNASQGDGATALHWAAHRNDLETAELLIDAGANVNAANDFGVTPLSLACTNRSAAMLGKLLQGGADPNATQETGETVLMTCARTGNLSAVKLLLSHGADPNARERRRGQTALMWALSGKHSAVVRTLVEQGAEVRVRSKAGFTPLMFAGQQGDIDSARVLLAAGADVNEGTPEHGNVLTVASGSGHEVLSIFLLDQGANPNSPESNGVTALHHALQQGLATLAGLKYDEVYRVLPSNMPELVKALLSHGADPNAQITNFYPLGPDAATQGRAGETPFFLAALCGDAGIMRVLLNNGADPRLAAKRNTTTLMAAAGGARGVTRNMAIKRLGDPLEAVKVVLELGVDLNATTGAGQTAMHYAAFTGEDEVIQLLVDHGAKVDVADRKGETPWTMAQGISASLGNRGSYGIHKSTVDLLLRLGATPRSREEMDTRSDPSGSLPPPGPTTPKP
ncbi:MAG: ankyrin repeat domain-containing protein [Anaerolineae bacterium]